jgi:hypothetical protein
MATVAGRINFTVTAGGYFHGNAVRTTLGDLGATLTPADAVTQTVKGEYGCLQSARGTVAEHRLQAGS